MQNKPVDDAMLLIDSIFRQAIEREKAKQAKARGEASDE